MNNKQFIKLGNKSFNIQMISYLNLNDDDLSVSMEINFESTKFKFKNEEQYNRFKSYIRLFSTEFEIDVEIVENDLQNNKSLLKD